VHCDDEPRVAALRARMRELDGAIDERARLARAAIQSARRRVRAEQRAAAGTRVRHPSAR
jgi:hypothetical protein